MPQDSPQDSDRHRTSHRAFRSTGERAALFLFAAGLSILLFGAVRFFKSPPIQTPARQHAVAVAVPIETTPTIQTSAIPDGIAEFGPEARDYAQMVIEEAFNNPKDAEAHGALGLLYDAYGFRQYALRCFANAIKSSPGNARWKYHWAVVAYDVGETDEAIAKMRDVCQSEPDYGPAHERLGLMLIGRGDFEEIDRAFQRVVELHPSAASGYLGRGRIRLATGRLEEAAKQFRHALARDPTNGQAHYLLGQTYQRLGRTEEARAQFAQGAKSHSITLPDPWRAEVTATLVGPKAKLEIARFLRNEGRLDEALPLLEQLNQLDPSNVDAANDLGITLLDLDRAPDALRVLNAALASGRRTYLTYAHLAAVHLKLGDLEAALENANQATLVAPMTGWGYFMKGRVCYDQKRYGNALVAFQQAAEFSPRDPNVYSRVGMTLVRLNRNDEAVEPFEIAAKLAPQSTTPLYNLGMVHAKANRLGKAAEALRRAMILDSTDRRVERALNRVEALLREPFEAKPNADRS